MQKVKVVGVTNGEYYSSAAVSGSTVNVTLQRGGDFVTCEGVLTWEEEDLDETFDEWVAYAVAGEEGFTAMLVENGVTTLYK